MRDYEPLLARVAMALGSDQAGRESVVQGRVSLSSVRTGVACVSTGKPECPTSRVVDAHRGRTGLAMSVRRSPSLQRQGEGDVGEGDASGHPEAGRALTADPRCRSGLLGDVNGVAHEAFDSGHCVAFRLGEFVLVDVQRREDRAQEVGEILDADDRRTERIFWVRAALAERYVRANIRAEQRFNLLARFGSKLGSAGEPDTFLGSPNISLLRVNPTAQPFDDCAKAGVSAAHDPVSVIPSRPGRHAGTVSRPRRSCRYISADRPAFVDGFNWQDERVSREAIAVEVELELRAGTDIRGPGGAVTAELCGHWEHDGPCRWPHNSQIDTNANPARLRTIVVVSDDDRVEVLQRIEAALRRDDRWTLARIGVRSTADDERGLAERLSQS